MIRKISAANDVDAVYLDRASYLESRLMGRPICRVNPKNILPLLEESEKESFPKVYLRIKPSGNCSDASKFTVTDEMTLTADVSSESVVNCSLKPVGNTVKHQYKFSKIFGPKSTQKQLFRETCLQPLKCFLRGENCLLFAYGATNAGKTYTIQGTTENPGIIPQSINMIFSALKGRLCTDCQYKPYRLENVISLDEAKQQEELSVRDHLLGCTVPLNNLYPLESAVVSNLKTNVDFSSPSFQAMKSHLDEVILNLEDEKSVTFSLWVSFYEIHNEVIYDLLDISSGCDVKRKPLSLGYVNGLAYIKDIHQVYVSSPDEAYRIYLTGKNNLQKAATALNTDSSRSHCVFSIKMVRVLNSENPQPVKVSVFSCVDLAGTERVKKTLNVGNRLRESQNINTSLYVLGRCLSIIRDNQRSQRKVRVPFRDSKLTQVFQYALTGNQGIAMIVNITFDPVMYLETVNVLKFSALARQILVEPQNTSCLNSTSMLSSKASLMKCNDTLTASFVTQVNDCNHLPIIKKLQQQLERECESSRELARQLESEKQRVREIDAHVREELTAEFSLLLQRTEDFWQKQVKSATEDEVDMGNFRIQQLKDFYEKKLKNAQDEVKLLHAQLKETKKSFKQEIDILKSQLEVQNTDGGDLVDTLRKQLAALTKELHNKNVENQVLTEKIEEAKEDFIMLEENRKSLLQELGMDSSSLVERIGSHVCRHGDVDDSSDDVDDCDVKTEITEEENDILEQNSIDSIEACDVISQDDSDIVVIDD
ncbi:kinesin-like protein KIF20B isoform X1 [Schistocerca nitens]|uniref:kinesin-like protein KIF20B isoform X1 n=2 Tax=Schistocerca nitens TaxID=7011 RepID=UPI002117478B|nr:kinesin-like protein KIF20B isoform X1 [Schistocerca nitens]